MRAIILSIALLGTLANPAIAGMVVGNGQVIMDDMRVGNGEVRMNNGTSHRNYGNSVNSTVSSHVVNGRSNSHTRITTRQNDGIVYSDDTYVDNGVSRKTYRNGDCYTEYNRVGTILKKEKVCF